MAKSPILNLPDICQGAPQPCLLWDTRPFLARFTGFCDSMKCMFDAIVTAYGIAKFVCVYINWKPCGEQPLFFFTQGINKQEEHAWVCLFYPSGPLPQPGFACYRRPALDPERFNGLNTKIYLNNYLFIKKKKKGTMNVFNTGNSSSLKYLMLVQIPSSSVELKSWHGLQAWVWALWLSICVWG